MFDRIPQDKAALSEQIGRETAHYLAKGGTITLCEPCKETWQLYAVASGEEGITLKSCKVLPSFVERKKWLNDNNLRAVQRGAYKAAREAGETPDQARVSAKTARRQYTQDKNAAAL